jgi:lipopolysaccharide transport system permease protein
MLKRKETQNLSSSASCNIISIKSENERSLISDIHEIWQFKQLYLALAHRDINVRYRQSALGLLWAFIQPIVTCFVFTFVFGHLIHVNSGAIPYPIFVFSGLLLWQFFSRNLSDGISSLVTNSTFINKVYFPRIGIPIISIFSSTLDFVLALLVLIVLMVITGTPLHWQAVFIPFILIGTLLLSFSVTLIFAPLNAIYRDIGFAMTFAIQFLMYLSPVIYPVTYVPDKYQWLFDFNPVATLLNAMRWALLGSHPPHLKAIGLFVLVTGICFLLGRKIFRSLEPTIVDRI